MSTLFRITYPALYFGSTSAGSPPRSIVLVLDATQIHPIDVSFGPRVPVLCRCPFGQLDSIARNQSATHFPVNGKRSSAKRDAEVMLPSRKVRKVYSRFCRVTASAHSFAVTSVDVDDGVEERYSGADDGEERITAEETMAALDRRQG
jgi:hypothetical protein